MQIRSDCLFFYVFCPTSPTRLARKFQLHPKRFLLPMLLHINFRSQRLWTKFIIMLFVPVFAASCGANDSSKAGRDTAVNATPGNSAGISTIGLDTAHMDTSLGRIQSDSAR